MEQNDPVIRKARVALAVWTALFIAAIAVIIWLWGWGVGITVMAVASVAFVMLCFSSLVAVAGNSHLLLAGIFAAITLVLYAFSLLLPFIYGKWFAVSWIIGVAPLAYVNAERLIEDLRWRRKQRRTQEY